MVRAHLVRQRRAARRRRRAAASAGGRFSKRSGLRPVERRVHGAQRLADVVDRDHARELDLGMDQQAPDQLRAAVAGAADDDGLESLHLRQLYLRAARRPIETKRSATVLRAVGLLADLHAVGADRLGRAVARALRLTARARHGVVVLVAGEVGRVGIAGGAEVLLRTAAREAEADDTGERADGQEPLHTSDDGRPRVSVSSRCATRAHPVSSRRRRESRLTAPDPSPTLKASCDALVSPLLTALSLLLLAGSSRAAPASATSGGIRLRAVVPAGPPPAIMPLSDGEARDGRRGADGVPGDQAGALRHPRRVGAAQLPAQAGHDPDSRRRSARRPLRHRRRHVGSPVYIEGQLVGALAYGWHFAKDPIAGVTPIETMLAERARPRRSGKEVWPRLVGARHVRQARWPLVERRASRTRRCAPARRARGAGARAGPAAGRADAAAASRASCARRCRCRSRASRARAFAELTHALAPTHVVPLQAGGAEPRAAGRGPRRAGTAIAVELIRGDLSRRHRHGHARRRRQGARVRPPDVQRRRDLPADRRRRDPHVHVGAVAVVQDGVAAQRDRLARAGSPVVHHRRPRRAPT